ncbi:hypothetical protein C0989_001308 [Termitomyces sp. Mn162]|nr:hypothetical protein C0989_001308 [Termitomyces sp. Mn162]
MAPHDDLLRTICHSDETFHEAQNILRTAKQRTGPLSGFNLGPLITGLPAVCAYIASTNLNNTDVTRKNAQIASCLKQSDFIKVLETVKAAFDGSPRRTRSGRNVYDILVQKYHWAFGHHLLNEWTSAVKRTLVLSDGANNSGPDLENAIFFWTYTTATGQNPATPRDFAAEHCTSAKSLTNLLNKLNECCASVETRIKYDIKVQRSPAKEGVTVTATPRRTPKRPLRILPSRDSHSPSKRKAVAQPQLSDDELDIIVHETPSKKTKTKGESPLKSTSSLQSPTKLVFPPIASSSLVTLDRVPKIPRQAPPLDDEDDEAMDVDEEANAETLENEEDEDDDVELEPPVRRRYRSVYADHRQWYAVDRRVRRIRRQAEQWRLEMMGSVRMSV